MDGEIHDYELSTFEEYSIVCEVCEINESTRSSSRDLAVSAAVSEGYKKLEGCETIACPSCYRALDGRPKSK